MYVDGPNPSKVQLTPAYKRSNPPAPLVLIHDGGGTTFGYFILGSLYREVWAMHNPRYWDSTAFEGGMDEMARLYIANMYESGLKGPIVLGGWSLGGYLSLAIARMLADDPEAKIRVTGMVIMDSPYHIAYSKIQDSTEDPTLEDIPDLIQKCFDHCDTMLRDWDLPQWEAPTMEGKHVSFNVGGKRHNVPPGKVLYKPLQGIWQTIDTKTHKHAASTASTASTAPPAKPLRPPPAVLIRCGQSMPLPADRTTPYLIDKYRNEPLLGWEETYPDFIKAVIDVDTTHYSMFDKSDHTKMKYLTSQINAAMEIIDSMRGPVMGLGASARITKPPMDYF